MNADTTDLRVFFRSTFLVQLFLQRDVDLFVSRVASRPVQQKQHAAAGDDWAWTMAGG